jgi:DNA-nicking Smr family endonuclease
MSDKNKKSEFEKLLEEYSDIDFAIHKREKSASAQEQADMFQMPTGHPDHELDLHGMTKEEAIRKVEMLVKEMRMRRITKLRIITGKGKHSENQPVIPDAVNDLLLSLKRNSFIRHIKWENRTVRNSGHVDVC